MSQKVVKINGAYYLEKYSRDGYRVERREPVAYSDREYKEMQGRCPPGKELVFSFTRKNGERVRSYCRKRRNE